ncbi:MAG: bacillithiol biosynthesis cysteine-adding enzyme BshC [bacterium]
MRTPMSQIPGAMPLVADYFENFENVAEFFNGNFRDPKLFLERTDEVKSRGLPIGQLVPILKEQNQRFGCGFKTLENIDLLLERRACAVVTGQQAGLFSGPLFTIYKALTAIKLAARLSRTCEGCFVPIFWVAADDHDFREVNHTKIVNKGNQVLELNYNAHPVDARVPVSAIRLSSGIMDVVKQLEDETHPSEFKETILNGLSEAYAPKRVFSEAFGTWLTQLFKAFGLVFIDASDPRIKALGTPIFQKEISEKSPSTERVLEISERLVQKKYHGQVQLHRGLLNLFFIENQRLAIEIQNGTFVVKGTNKSFQTSELLSLLKRKPHYFSPNVLLRPIFQDALLPTVAYVAGTAEISYYAQMKGIYEHFGLPMPIIYPRKSLTLLENKIEKVLDNYDLSVQDFWGDVEILINNIAKAQLPASIEDKIGKASECIEKDLQSLEDEVNSFDSTLKDTVEVVKGKINHQIDVLEKKILQAYKKRNEIVRSQIYKAKNNLYPNNHLQERELNVVPFLFKYGFGFIDRLYEALDISNFEHQIFRL